MKPRFQKNNTKDNSPKYEHLANLSDSTTETIHTKRKKLQIGRTQFQRKNSIKIHTEYNDNMKQIQLRKAPTNNNTNKRTPNLTKKQNKYMGQYKINPNPNQIKNSRTNDQNQNNNMKQVSNNTTTNSTTKSSQKSGIL